MFAYLESLLISLAGSVSLPVFAFFASFTEELIAPIPSPSIMLITGSLASLQGYMPSSLLSFALIGALGKTLGALCVYMIADKAENLIMTKFERYFGVTHEDIERLGSKLGRGIRDYAVLTLTRALPFIPSVVVSVGSGILKIPIRVFVVTTLLGTIVRDGFYIYAGYIGLEMLKNIIDFSTHIEAYLEYAAAGIVLGVIVYAFFRKRKRAV
jgi:membrane protein DedA with SNARE-associated domain